MTGHAPVDKNGLMALAREIGKNLSDFKAPDGYVPKPVLPEAPLPPVTAKTLGAQSLEAFFRRLPSAPGQSSEPYPPLANLPRGLEALDWAISVTDQVLEDFNQAAQIDPRRQSRRRTEMVTAKASLLRARHMADQFKSMLEEWADESRATYRGGLELADSVHDFIGRSKSNSQNPVDLKNISLTTDSAKLSERLRQIRKIFDGRLSWQIKLKALIDEIESLTATAGDDPDILDNQARFWNPAISALTKRLKELEENHADLSQKTKTQLHMVAASLAALDETEKVLLGQTGSDLKRHSEFLSENVETLLRNTLSLCQELRNCWRVLPSLVGRPKFVDKTIVTIAAHYGKTFTVGEELRGILARFTGRMSSTCEVRAKAKKVLALPNRSREYKAVLERSKKRLSTLNQLVQFKASSHYHKNLAASRELDLQEQLRLEEVLTTDLKNKNEE
jgi:hypothetical protein